MAWCSGYHYCTVHSTNPELRFCTGSNPAHGMLEIHDGEDLWQWSLLEIRLNTFCLSIISQKQFIKMEEYNCKFKQMNLWCNSHRISLYIILAYNETVINTSRNIKNQCTLQNLFALFPLCILLIKDTVKAYFSWHCFRLQLWVGYFIYFKFAHVCSIVYRSLCL